MKLVVYFNNAETFVNIPADRIVKDEEFVMVYNGAALVGMFDVGVVAALYLSEKGATR